MMFLFSFMANGMKSFLLNLIKALSVMVFLRILAPMLNNS